MKTKYHIGCSGWVYPGWRGKFYPKDLPQSHWFDYYKKYFNSVEINYTFYKNITEKNLEHWYDVAPSRFHYNIKAHRLFTHYKKFRNTRTLLKIFYKKLDILEHKLGCVLFQFPKNYIYHPETLDNIISQLDTSKKNVLEFRHESWWQPEVFCKCQKNNIIFCSLDAPKLPRILIPSKKSSYIRFHGRHFWYLGNYNEAKLQFWIDAIKRDKITTAWCYFNNDVGGYAPKNALSLREMI